MALLDLLDTVNQHLNPGFQYRDDGGGGVLGGAYASMDADRRARTKLLGLDALETGHVPTDVPTEPRGWIGSGLESLGILDPQAPTRPLTPQEQVMAREGVLAHQANQQARAKLAWDQVQRHFDMAMRAQGAQANQLRTQETQEYHQDMLADAHAARMAELGNLGERLGMERERLGMDKTAAEDAKQFQRSQKVSPEQRGMTALFNSEMKSLNDYEKSLQKIIVDPDKSAQHPNALSILKLIRARKDAMWAKQGGEGITEMLHGLPDLYPGVSNVPATAPGWGSWLTGDHRNVRSLPQPRE